MKLLRVLANALLHFCLLLEFASGQSDVLPRSTPESQGVSSAAIADFIESADRQVNSMHSFMLVRHGQVVAEAWWEPESAVKPHVLWSLSKSFTSTAVGLAVAEGKLSIDDPVLQFFPDDAPSEPSANLKAMRVRDLLTMSTGHQVEVKLTSDIPWVKAFLAHRRSSQTRHAFSIQHSSHVHAVGHRAKSDRRERAGIPDTQTVRAAGYSSSNLG